MRWPPQRPVTCHGPPTSLTILLANGRVHSPAMPDATAMAVRDGIVVWLGTDDVGRVRFPAADLAHLDRGFVAPAFVDTHAPRPPTRLSLARLAPRRATSAAHP